MTATPGDTDTTFEKDYLPIEGFGRPGKPSWETYYLALAHIVSWRSGCLGAPVGALIVRNNRILTTGYNGTPEGWPNCDEESGCPRCFTREYDTPEKRERAERDGKTIPVDVQHLPIGQVTGKSLDLCVCVHAEANALITAARFGIAIDGAEVYVTDMPCMQCAKELLQAGISRITYSRYYGVSDDDTRIGQLVLSTQQQLMRDLRARKYRFHNVASELHDWATWLNEPHKYGLEIPRPRTALDDDQYTDKGRPEFVSWRAELREAQLSRPDEGSIRHWLKGVGLRLNGRGITDEIVAMYRIANLPQ